MVIFLLSIQSLGEILSGDAFAGIIFAIMAGIVIYMIHDGCKNMTMYCLFMLGIMSGFQCFFDILGLLSVLGGRETTSSTVEGTDQDVTVITKITMHPFFDKKMDDQYNLQSLMMLLSPGVMSVSCTMCDSPASNFVGQEKPDIGYARHVCLLSKQPTAATVLKNFLPTFFGEPRNLHLWVPSIFGIPAPTWPTMCCFPWGYLSYNAFSDSLFELDDEADPIYSRGFATGVDGMDGMDGMWVPYVTCSSGRIVIMNDNDILGFVWKYGSHW